MIDNLANTKLRIVYVWDADYPWDVRTEKTCLALTQAGHDVHIVARNSKHEQLTESLPEATVHRMRPWRVVGKRLDVALGFPAFFSPRWRSLISNTAGEVNADLIIVRDIPLCPTAISVSKRLGIPVILDMAENYPAMMRDIWTAQRHSLTDYLVRNPKLTELVEKYCIKRVDHIITVVEASSRRLRKLGVAQEDLTVVSNTPPSARTAGRQIERSPSPDGRITVAYLGLLELPRGIGDLIDAIDILHRTGHTEFSALIVGGGRDEDLFRKRAEKLGLSESDIRFFGRLPHGEALSVIATADIGIIPHHATECWNTTIPNKLFDYMSMALPVVSSDAEPCRDVISATGAGRTFRSGDAHDMAATLLNFQAEDTRKSAGDAGVKAVLQTYNWESDTDRLNRIVYDVALRKTAKRKLRGA